MNLSLLLYLSLAFSGAAAAFLGTDEAAKYIEPEHLFWARGINTIFGGVALTMKGYISQGFQEWLAGKAGKKQEHQTANDQNT